jgi:hypothetical protein
LVDPPGDFGRAGEHDAAHPAVGNQRAFWPIRLGFRSKRSQ